jgi:hypothetical protein
MCCIDVIWEVTFKQNKETQVFEYRKTQLLGPYRTRGHAIIPPTYCVRPIADAYWHKWPTMLPWRWGSDCVLQSSSRTNAATIREYAVLLSIQHSAPESWDRLVRYRFLRDPTPDHPHCHWRITSTGFETFNEFTSSGYMITAFKCQVRTRKPRLAGRGAFSRLAPRPADKLCRNSG